MDHVNVLTAFLAGIVMFLAPCTLPLLPGFVAYLSHGERERMMKSALLFCAGFLVTFLIFGILAGLLGHVLAPAKYILEKVGGVFVVILGISMLGIFHLPFFHGQLIGQNLRELFKGKFSPFIFGISIALGWSPCVGPVLAGIFFYAAFSYSVFQALWLFLFFALGFIVPFLLIAWLMKRGKRVTLGSSKLFSVIAGLILIFIGILLIAGNFNMLATWFYAIFSFINYEAINSLL